VSYTRSEMPHAAKPCNGCGRTGTSKVSGLCNCCQHVLLTSPELEAFRMVMVDKAMELNLFNNKRERNEEHRKKKEKAYRDHEEKHRLRDARNRYYETHTKQTGWK